MGQHLWHSPALSLRFAPGAPGNQYRTPQQTGDGSKSWKRKAHPPTTALGREARQSSQTLTSGRG
jgi:hypothetical protein